MHRLITRTLLTFFFILVVYGLLGALVLPGVALQLINQQLGIYATLPAELRRIEFNPYSLELTLYGFSLGLPDQRTIAVERLSVDVDWDSLWRQELHIASIGIRGPQIHIAKSADGTLNATQWFKLPPSESEDAATEEPSGDLLPFTLDQFRLQRGAFSYQDLSLEQPVDLSYQGLEFDLNQLSSRAGAPAGEARLDTSSGSNQIRWQGQLNLVPEISSSGQLSVTDFDLLHIWPFVQPSVPLILEQGKVSISTHYQFLLQDSPQLLLEQTVLDLQSLALHGKKPSEAPPRLMLKQFRIEDTSYDLQKQQAVVGKILTSDLALQAPRQSKDAPLLTLNQFNIEQTRVDLQKQQVVVGKVDTKGLETRVRRNRQGQLDWQLLLAEQLDSDGAKAAASTTATEQQPTAAADTGPGWQVRLEHFQLRDYRVHARDEVPQDSVALDVGPLNIDVRNLDTAGKSPFQLNLDTGIGQKGRLEAGGEIRLGDLSGTVTVKTQNLDLSLAEPYIQPFARINLNSGLLNTNLKVALRDLERQDITVTGSAGVTQLQTQDSERERDLLNWQRLDFRGIEYQHGTSLSISAIELDEPYLRFTINPDLTTNINDILVSDNSSQAAEPTSQQSSSSSSSSEAMAIRVGGIKIKNGSSDFADFSLQPNFAAAIQSINGQVGSLDSRKVRQPASVTLSGKVDRYSPVRIKGSLTPFDPLQSLDIATSFHRIELTTLTPYSGKFAGFRIRKGRMDLDLHYRIKAGQLNADNKVVVDQLELGEKVDSPSAVDLPLRLGIALLKDPEGVISLELPVEGDLNSPEFSVWPIIGQTLGNIITKAAQAPFRLLGSLIPGGGEAELDNVDFEPGSSEMTADSRKGLEALAQGLRKRPQLSLEVEAASASNSDGPILARQDLQRRYQQAWFRILKVRGAQVPADPSKVQVSETAKPTLAQGIYRKLMKEEPPRQGSEQSKQAYQLQLEQAVLQKLAQSNLLLRQLGQARAAEVKRYLVEQGRIADQRIYLLDPDLAPEGAPQTQLHLTTQ